MIDFYYANEQHAASWHDADMQSQSIPVDVDKVCVAYCRKVDSPNRPQIDLRVQISQRCTSHLVFDRKILQICSCLWSSAYALRPGDARIDVGHDGDATGSMLKK